MLQKYFYKITKDLLISLTITYFILLIPELILPGIVSSHLNPKFILIALIILGLAYSWQGKKYSVNENIKFRAISRNILNIILFIVLIMLLLSLYKMKLFQIIVVTILSILLFVAAEKFMIDEKDPSQ